MARLQDTTPHLHGVDSTAGIMWWVNAALAPAALWGVFVFGWSALFAILGAIAGSLAAEWLACRGLKRRPTLSDGSAFCTGLLLAMCLPPGVAWWMAVLGGAFSIWLGKSIFGGLGYNVFNPALLGRAFLQAAFPVPITTWPVVGGSFWSLRGGNFALPLMRGDMADAVTAARRSAS